MFAVTVQSVSVQQLNEISLQYIRMWSSFSVFYVTKVLKGKTKLRCTSRGVPVPWSLVLYCFQYVHLRSVSCMFSVHSPILSFITAYHNCTPTVLWISFRHNGPISLCIHLLLFVCFLCVSVSYCVDVVLLWARWGGPDGIEA